LLPYTTVGMPHLAIRRILNMKAYGGWLVRILIDEALAIPRESQRERDAAAAVVNAVSASESSSLPPVYVSASVGAGAACAGAGVSGDCIMTNEIAYPRSTSAMGVRDGWPWPCVRRGQQRCRGRVIAAGPGARCHRHWTTSPALAGCSTQRR
jgi:hypothetical protein